MSTDVCSIVFNFYFVFEVFKKILKKFNGFKCEIKVFSGLVFVAV